MTADEDRKKVEIVKCRFILSRLRSHLNGLDTLMLDGAEQGAMKEIYLNMDRIQGKLAELYVDKELKPPVVAQGKNTRRGVRR